MGGRDLPYECRHGKTIDWGDFGPDPDDGTVGVEDCQECRDEQLADAIEAFRKALMVEHHDDWDMETISEAAHICARVIVGEMFGAEV